MLKKVLLTSLLPLCLLSSVVSQASQAIATESNPVAKSSDVEFSWERYWDSDIEESRRTFSNLEGSGIDLNIRYSQNQAWQLDENHFGLNLYEKAYPPQLSSFNDYHDLNIYNGILRITNHTSSGLQQDRAFVEFDFSEPVDLNDFWLGSLSLTHQNRVREWFKFTAYDAEGNIIAPSRVAPYEDFYGEQCTQTQNQPGDICNVAGADDPSYVDILPQADGSVLLRGNADAGQGKYGRTFFAAEGISSIRIEFYATVPSDDSQHSNWYTSAAISNTFTITPSSLDPGNGIAQAIPDLVAFQGNQAFPGYNVLENDLNTDPDHLLEVAEVNGKKVRGNGFKETLASGSQIQVDPNGELVYIPSPQVANRLFSDVTTETFSYSIVDPEGAISTTQVSLQVTGFLFPD